MLTKIIAAILTIGAMGDFEKHIGVEHLDDVERRACLWAACYKSMLKYLRSL